MNKQDFKNGGFIEFDEESSAACALVNENGSDVYLKGSKNNVCKAIVELALAFLKNLKPEQRIAFLQVLREKVYEEDLMSEDTEWILKIKGIEFPVTLKDSLSFLMKMYDEIKKDR